MKDTEITIILPTSAAKEIFFDGWLHGFEPSTWLKKCILRKLSAPVIEETPEHRAALPHVAAPVTTPAPEPPAVQAPQPAAAGSSGMFDNIPA